MGWIEDLKQSAAAGLALSRAHLEEAKAIRQLLTEIRDELRKLNEKP